MLEVWQTDQGLPQNSVYTIVQTRDGYLWMGTEGGLARFDGVRFTVFDSRNTPELVDDWIQVLHEDREGSLWMGTTHGGLVRMRDGVFTSFTKDGPLGDFLVRAILEIADGALLVATEGNGLYLLKDGRFRLLLRRGSFERDSIYSLLETGPGSFLVGSDTGVTRMTCPAGLGAGPAPAVPCQFSPFLPETVTSRVVGMHRDRRGVLWLASTRGLFQVGTDGTVRRFGRAEVGRDILLSVYEDASGTLFFGTLEGPLARREADGTFTTLGAREGLSDERVYAMLEDREGSLWLGTGGGGVTRLRDGKVLCFGIPEGLRSNHVNSVAEDAEGRLFAPQDDGSIDRVRDWPETCGPAPDAEWQGHPEKPLGPEALAWARSQRGLLTLARPEIRATLLADSDFRSRIDMPFLVVRNGDLWASNYPRGLARFPGGKGPATLFLEGVRVFAILEDRAGSLWVGSSAQGLFRLRNGTVTSFKEKGPLPGDLAWSLLEDSEGSLWVGTYTKGLCRLGRADTFTCFGTADGLVENVVFSIFEDSHGGFFTSGNRGVSRIERKQLEDYEAGRVKRLTPQLFGTAEGMRIAETSGGRQPAAHRTRDGRLWFPTPKGFAVIDPERIPHNAVPPPVVLEDLVVNGTVHALSPEDAGTTLILPAGVSKLEIHYAALSFRVPRRVKFRYRLEGFDPDWSDAGTERAARYTSVSPGAYTFRVIACNDDGVWNETGASVSFTVPPLYYQTWWFYALVALGFVSVGLAAQRVRVSHLKAQREELSRVVEERTRSLAERTLNLEAERERADTERLKAESANRAKSAFLANMSHELRTPLNAVLGFAQLMGRRKGRDPEDLEHLAIIGRSGEHLLNLINDVLSLSKVEAGAVTISPSIFEPAHFLKGLFEMLRVRAEGKGLELVFEPAVGFPPAVVGDDGKLRQILINLLGNAVKFTEQGRVVFRARWANGEARFEVEDTGPGLTAAEIEKLFQPFVQTETGRRVAEGTGLGLTISRSFARLMGGDISVASEAGRSRIASGSPAGLPGRGSVFTVTIPLAQAAEEAVVSARRRGDRRQVVGLATGEPARLLLVADDVAENRLLLTRLLESTGFRVVEAVDGEDAIRRWEEARPELIFMDVRMPVLDGLAATRRIRGIEAARGTGERVRVVALSASVLQHEKGDILEAGCDDFLAKPFRSAAIFDKLVELLGVRFEYDAAPVSRRETPPAAGVLTAQRLAAVSEDRRERLHSAVKVGDDEAALLAAEEIRAEDAALAEALLKAIGEFQLSRLLSLMEKKTP